MEAVERIQCHAARTTPGFAIGEAEFRPSAEPRQQRLDRASERYDTPPGQGTSTHTDRQHE